MDQSNNIQVDRIDDGVIYDCHYIAFRLSKFRCNQDVKRFLRNN